uniref:Serpin domain-containing protein n=1 Tax=Glossina austeni TaxID=7395 RepID=A0A1A9VSQ1_GLOAU
MSVNEYFKRQWKNPIVLLLLSGFALFAKNGTAYTEASGICPCFEQFADDFFTEQSQRNNDTNFVFSPFAMQSFEDLVKLGFSDKPELPDDNFSEIMEDLKDSEAVKMEYKVHLPEGREIEPSRLALLQKKFPSTFVHIDDSNAWMMKAIEQHLRNLNELEKLMGNKQAPSEALVEINTEVNTDWLHPFDEQATKVAEFHTDDNRKVDMPFMHQVGNLRTAEMTDLQAKVIEMPFKNQNVSMWLYLPDEEDGLDELEEKLKLRSLNSIEASMSEREVDVLLPKFEDTHEMDLDGEISRSGLDYPLSQTDEAVTIQRPASKLQTKLAMYESLEAHRITDSEGEGHVIAKRHAISLHTESSENADTEVKESGEEVEGEEQGESVGEVDVSCATDDCLKFHAAHPFIYHVVYKHSDQVVPIVMGCFRNLNINIDAP